jgi:DNA-binding MarR family transcriptional regulator
MRVMLTTMTEVEERLGHLVKSLEQELSGAKDAVLRPLGLTVPQYQALLVIASDPGISGAELARRCLVTPQTMTTVLGNLTAKGLISRRSVPGQGRAMETSITAAGRKLLGRADKRALEVEDQLGAALSVRDQAAFRKMLERCRTAFEKAEERPAPAEKPRAATRRTPTKRAAAKKAPARKASTAKRAVKKTAKTAKRSTSRSR